MADDHDDDHDDEKLEGDPELGPDGRYLPVPCVVCGTDTQLRCTRCRTPVCHAAHDCPNGCDTIPFDSTFGKRVGERH